MSIIVNGHEAEPGCYIDGHHGQYGEDRLAELAEGYGWKPRRLCDRMDLLRKLAERADERYYADQAQYVAEQMALGMSDDAARAEYRTIAVEQGQHGGLDFWEARHWLADELEEWLNDHTTGGVWGWHEGEFFLEDADDDDTSFFWVCYTCHAVHCNGDAGEVPDDYPEPWSKFDDEHWIAHNAEYPDRVFGETGYEEFSSRHCEACGQHLAGDRYRYSMWPNQAAQESYLTTMFHAYQECALWSSTHTPYGRIVPRDELTRYHDHRGMFHQTCPHCHVTVILFDDDEHWCDQAEGDTVPMDDVDAELHQDALDEMRADCEGFMKAEWAFVCGLDPAQVGHDFWLTRNHHGTGFWDRGHPDWLGRHLTDAAHAYGSADLVLGDDGYIHHS